MVSTVPAALYPNDSVLVTLLARFADGTGAAGCLVSVVPSGVVEVSQSLVSAVDGGTIQFTVTAGSAIGMAGVDVAMPGGLVALHIDLPILLAPDSGPNLVGATVAWDDSYPDTLAITGFCGFPAPPCQTEIHFGTFDAQGQPAGVLPLTATEVSGEALVTISPASMFSDSVGVARVTVTSAGLSGTAHIVAALPNGATGIALVPILGAPSKVQATDAGSSVILLGVAGEGVAETGTVVFQVSDDAGNPFPGAIEHDHAY